MDLVRTFFEGKVADQITEGRWPVLCRGLMMPRATAWLYTPYQILVLSRGVL